MPNKLIYPLINPLPLFSPDPVTDDRYTSKDMDDYEFPDTILPWEQRTGFCQPWKLSDTIPLQLQSNVGPINFILKDCGTDEVIDTVPFVQKQESLNEPGLFIYELSLPLSGYPDGCHYGEIDFGGLFSLFTGELDLQELHPEHLYIEFKHFETREDIIFETGWLGAVRIPGVKEFLGPKQKSTTYEDQVLDTSVLRAQKFREWALQIGLGKGIPDYFADMIGGIIGCSDFRVDGKRYAFPNDAEMEPTKVGGYGKKWWSIAPMRERYNLASKVFENDIPVGGLIAAMVNVDSKGFGNQPGGSLTAIQDVY